jgi:hypothetical protein
MTARPTSRFFLALRVIRVATKNAFISFLLSRILHMTAGSRLCAGAQSLGVSLMAGLALRDVFGVWLALTADEEERIW